MDNKVVEAWVKADGLHVPGYPLIFIPDARTGIENTSWGIWLCRNKKFRCDLGNGLTFTAHKTSKQYWIAQRRVNTKLRNQYLGQSSDLIFSRLWEIARKMALPDGEYWREAKSSLQESAMVALKLLEEFIQQEDAKNTGEGELTRFAEWLKSKSGS